MPKGKRDPDQIVPSTIAIRTDGMKPEVLDRLEQYIRNDGIRTAVTIAVRALVEYIGFDVDKDLNGLVYTVPPRTRSTVKLSPEEKKRKQEDAANAKRMETHRALKFMEFVTGLTKQGKALDATALQAFEKWFATQPLPEKRKRGPNKNSKVTVTPLAQ